jgi:hypothetical protein
MKYLRLKNQKTCFTDPETLLTIVCDDVVPYVPPVGRMTRQWLNGGGLVMFDVPDDPPEDEAVELTPEMIAMVEPETNLSLDVPCDEELAYRFYTKEEAEKMKYFTLKKVVAAFGAKPDKHDDKQELIRKLMERQAEVKAQL